MYCLVSEKPLRLVYGTFYLAISYTFYETVKIGLFTSSSNLLPPYLAAFRLLSDIVKWHTD
jgi:hypothetical protein